MNIDQAVLRFAGTMILVSLALAYFVSPYWLGLTVVIGGVMLQSGFTGFCPIALVFKRLGVKPGSAFR